MATPYTGQSYSTYTGSDIANASNYASNPGASTGVGAMPLLYGMQAVSGAYSSYMQGKAQKRIAETNRRLAEMRAEDALKRGHEAEAVSRGRTKKLIGSQRAALAAQGIRVDYGSAQDIQQEAADIGELDALSIRTNALREAFGAKSEGLSASMQGRFAEMESQGRVGSSLLTGGLQAYDAYKRYGR